MPIVPVHKSNNVRKLRDIDISQAILDLIDKPPPLRTLEEMRNGRPHLVEIKTENGALRLFKVKANGVEYIATDTDDVALKTSHI